MRIEIEIPKAFEYDYNTDRFKEFFERVLCDIKGGDLCGRYEQETAEMLIGAFKESKVIQENKTTQQDQSVLDYETATEILQNPVFDDDCSWMGAVTFVSEAFNCNIDKILEEIVPRSQTR